MIPFLVVTPGASRLADGRRREAVITAARTAIRARTGRDPELRITAHAAAGRVAVREAVAIGARLVVVAGGDGSVRTAAAVLRGTGIPLESSPPVPATCWPRHSPSRGRWTRRSPRSLRPGSARSTWAGSRSAGTRTCPRCRSSSPPAWASTPRAMAATSARSKRSLGARRLLRQRARVAARLRSFEVLIVVDGVVHRTEALAVLVANAGELVPGLVRPRLPLVPDDGLLDVLVARGRGPLGGSRAALELLLGRDVHVAIGPFSARMVGRHVEVEASGPEPIEVDGDVVGLGVDGRRC